MSYTIECPLCGKQITRDEMALSAHLRAKIHGNITPKKRQKIIHDIIGLRGKPSHQSQEKERDLAKNTGIN